MKKALHIMLTLSKVLGLIAARICLIFGIVAFAGAGSQPDTNSQAAMIAYGVYLIIIAILEAVSAIIAFIVGPSMEKLDASSKGKSIFCIVFGAVSTDVFLLLAGIFCLVARNQKN